MSGRGPIAVAAAVAASLGLVAIYLALGGSSYEPTEVADPCEPREWRSPQGAEEVAEQFALSALDGAACELRVTRETLVAGIASEEARGEFAAEYGIDDARLEDAIQAGLVRAVDDAEDAGALPGAAALPLREVLSRLPVDEGIALIRDARVIFEDVGGFLEGAIGEARGAIEGARELLEEAEALGADVEGALRELVPGEGE